MRCDLTEDAMREEEVITKGDAKNQNLLNFVVLTKNSSGNRKTRQNPHRE